MGKICYIMGKSASGKDSIFKELRRRLPEYRDIVLYTTRPIRAGETDGVEYHFVDEKKLRELENAGRVIEQRAYETVHGIWRYFTADDGQIDLQHHDYLMIGTLESYEAMKEYFGKEIISYNVKGQNIIERLEYKLRDLLRHNRVIQFLYFSFFKKTYRGHGLKI